MKRRNKIFKAAVCVALAAFGAVLMLYPERYIKACFSGICLWAECVLPSLFPFMVITLLLSYLGAVNAAARPLKKLSAKLKLPQQAFPLFILSAVSGYPAGSRLVQNYCESGQITRSDAQKLAPLCSLCSPLFALGSVGSKAFGSAKAGAMLLFAAYISVILPSLLYALLSKTESRESLRTLCATDGDNILYSAFYGGVTASLTAGGFICFFHTLSQVIYDFKLLTPIILLIKPLLGDCAEGLCIGLCEATGGCFAVAGGGFYALPCAAFLTVFGGGSIILQQLCYLIKCKVSPLFFILFKFMQGILAFLVVCAMQLL